jgi:hypothetical protein
MDPVMVVANERLPVSMDAFKAQVPVSSCSTQRLQSGEALHAIKHSSHERMLDIVDNDEPSYV